MVDQAYIELSLNHLSTAARWFSERRGYKKLFAYLGRITVDLLFEVSFCFSSVRTHIHVYLHLLDTLLEIAVFVIDMLLTQIVSIR